jgi:hypothetical protein
LQQLPTPHPNHLASQSPPTQPPATSVRR